MASITVELGRAVPGGPAMITMPNDPPLSVDDEAFIRENLEHLVLAAMLLVPSRPRPSRDDWERWNRAHRGRDVPPLWRRALARLRGGHSG